MKILFLGTGAADFSPLLATEFRFSFDKNARRSSSVLIDNTILIDCGPHVLDAFRIQGILMEQVTDLLVTHFHDDHFNRENVAKLASECRQPLRMWYCAQATPEPMENVIFCPLQPGQRFSLDRGTGVALAANHTAWPLHYDLELGGKRLFYGCDGAWLLNDTFNAMKGRMYDCMILDGTVGDYNGDFRLSEHNSIPMIRLMEASFRTQKVIGERGVVCLSHIARTLHEPHDILSEKMAKEGYTVAFDGFTLDII